MAKVVKVFVNSSYKLSQDYSSIGDELGFEVEISSNSKENRTQVIQEFFSEIDQYLRKRAKKKVKRGIVKSIIGVKQDDFSDL